MKLFTLHFVHEVNSMQIIAGFMKKHIYDYEITIFEPNNLNSNDTSNHSIQSNNITPTAHIEIASNHSSHHSDEHCHIQQLQLLAYHQIQQTMIHLIQVFNQIILQKFLTKIKI